MSSSSSSSWLELSHFLASPPPPPPRYHGALPPPPPSIGALAFDTSSDLLLTGNSNGAVSTWHGSGLSRYTAWRADIRQTVTTDADAISSNRKLQTSWKKASASLQPSGGANRPGDNTGGVREIVCDSGHAFSVLSGGVHCANRRGIARWSKDVSSLKLPTLSLSTICASPAAASSDLVVGGSSLSSADQQLVLINRHVGSVSRMVPSESPIHQVRSSQRYLLSSTPGGHVQLRDPRSLEIQHKLHAHPGGLIDMKSEGSLVWSVGWTLRLGHPVPEPLIKIHDLRSMRALVPIPFAAPGGPSLLDIHPRIRSTVVVAASQGAWQIVDMNSPGEAGFYQLQSGSSGSSLTALSISPSSEYIAFGESDGTVRLWSTSETSNALSHPDSIANAPKFNHFTSQELELPDAPETYARPIEWTAETPLSSLGLPFYDAALLSNIPFESYAAPSSPLFNPFPPKIDDAVLPLVRVIDGVRFAPLPKHLRGKRNLVKVTGKGFPAAPGRLNAKEGRRQQGARGPMFRSEKIKAQQRQNGSSTDDGDVEDDLTSNEHASSGPPSHWRKKDIVYSKFGVEDFDFEFYNHTQQSGLETHIPNCYLNSLLQCLYALGPIRTLSETHSLAGGKHRCERPECLLCEAGFLFMMLRDGKGANCQATNFLRAFSRSERAVSLGLMDSDDLSHSTDVAYANLAQSANRFLMDNLASSWAEQAVASADSDSDQLKHTFENALAASTRTVATCLSCGQSTYRPSKALVVDLQYPRRGLSNERVLPTDFASVLRASLLRENVTRSPCKNCGNPNATTKSIRELPETSDLPSVLSINANILTSEHMALWANDSEVDRKQGKKAYLPKRLSIKSGLGSTEIRDFENSDELSRSGAAVYELKAIVSQVQALHDPAHLVAVVCTAGEGIASAEGTSAATWHLFNDFSVRPIPEEEALGFPTASWKIPAIIFYERSDRQTFDPSSTAFENDLEVLTQDSYITRNRDPSQIRHRPFTPEEIPKPGCLMAIDAEFVALNPEELEISSSGGRSIVRPSTMSLARVSVLRGEGAHEGEPFIDDHIATTEKIFDYLTQFSGIVDGDLDPLRSRHTVVPHKLAYKKLRLLVDLGCVFIGHGLKKDFRIINIFVPPSQVIDTVDLYSSTSQARKLSLRFLSWFLLKEAIQSGGDDALSGSAAQQGSGESTVIHGHDSIEDARAALHLYRAYESFQRDKRLADVMEDLYEEGKRLNWRPPPTAASTAAIAANVANVAKDG